MRRERGGKEDRQGESLSHRHVKLCIAGGVFSFLHKDIEKTTDKLKMLCSVCGEFKR